MIKHRAVWLKHYLSSPYGWHIHHVDGDAFNNNILNLECVSPVQHVARHRAMTRERKPKDELLFPCSFAISNSTKAKLAKIAERMKLTPSGAFRKLVDERARRWRIKEEGAEDDISR